MNSLMVVLFLVIFAFVLISISVGFKVIEDRRKKKVQGILATAAAAGGSYSQTKVLHDEREEHPFERAITRLSHVARLTEMIQQAGLDWTVPKLFGIMAVTAVIGVLVSTMFPVLLYKGLSAVVLAAAFACLPVLYVSWKRRRRFGQFEEQFPEALDFLARSMRAGHAFSVSLEMLGEESPEPLGQEFRVLFNEQNLGAPIETALHNLVTRVPLLDVRFFVSSVLLQRQTGGNLSEILVRLSYVIRERFRLKGQVKAVSAHGRITAAILTGMPIIVAILLSFVAPGYLSTMARDSDGKLIIIASILLQLLGYLWMKSIINIKV